jgi:hypothetical protein
MDGYQNQEEFEADQEEFEPWDWIYYCNTKWRVHYPFEFWMWLFNVLMCLIRLKITKNVIMILVFDLLCWW